MFPDQRVYSRGQHSGPKYTPSSTVLLERGTQLTSHLIVFALVSPPFGISNWDEFISSQHHGIYCFSPWALQKHISILYILRSHLTFMTPCELSSHFLDKKPRVPKECYPASEWLNWAWSKPPITRPLPHPSSFLLWFGSDEMCTGLGVGGPGCSSRLCCCVTVDKSFSLSELSFPHL